MTRGTEAWLIVGMLVCSVLGVFVVRPLVATLGPTAKVLGGAALFVAIIWFIGWGNRPRPTRYDR